MKYNAHGMKEKKILLLSSRSHLLLVYNEVNCRGETRGAQ